MAGFSYQDKRKPADPETSPAQRKSGAVLQDNRAGSETAQRKANHAGGLPENIRSGVESLSGMSMDHVRVHYNSSRPAQLNSHAYAQGSDIHLGPGQEQHLPHEAWHVVQQAQGRVKPTMQMGGTAINNDTGLESEADRMGARAASMPLQRRERAEAPRVKGVAQAVGWETLGPANPRRYLPVTLGGYTDDQMAENGLGTTHTAEQQPGPVESSSEPEKKEEVAQAPEEQKVEEKPEEKKKEKEAEKKDDDVVAPVAQQDVQEGHQLEEENKEAKAEWDKQAFAFVMLLMAALVAWQTYRERQGKESKGRGAHLYEILSQIDEQVTHAKDLVQQAQTIRQHPILEGFKLGVNPMPMPAAREYATFDELRTSFFRIIFLLGASKEDMAKYHARTGLPVPNEVREKRNKVMGGYGIGFGVGGKIQGMLPIVSHPATYLQGPWDAFHIVNKFAISSRNAEKQLNASQRKFYRYHVRMQRQMGKQVLRNGPQNLVKWLKFIK